MLVTIFLSLALHEQRPLFPADAKLEKVWDKGFFTEGPAEGKDGHVYFSDIGNAILKFDPISRKTVVFREPSGRANGLAFDSQGRLIACEGANVGGNRRITRTEKDGTLTVLADRWNGKRFNSPNDLVLDKNGLIYFTDPRYVGDEPREIDTESVYRVTPEGKVSRIITDVAKPNGIILAPDEQTLYVADSSSKVRQLLAYPILKNGEIGKKRILHDFGDDRGIDGMTIDEKGRIFATAGKGKSAGIHVFDPSGKKLAFLPTPEDPSNCVFAGKNRDVLYVTAGKSLYRTRVHARGLGR